MTNIVVLRGQLSRPAEERLLPSGDRLVALDITVRRSAEPADSVPVAWFEAPASAANLDTGDEVVVVGRVRRRFFRTAAAGTQSRTEVVAASVIPIRQAKRIEAALTRARAALDDVLAEPMADSA